MTAGLFPPIELVQQPRVQDITAGRPYRFAGIPVSNDPPLNAVSYWLEVTADDKYGSTVVFALGPTGLPVFELTAQQTAQLGTLLASTGANGFDNTGGTTAVGWYRIYGQGTNVITTETETQLSGHGPVLVRLTSQLRRKDKILLGSGTCGCAGGPVCGCGNGSGCATCDHPLPGDTDGCNVLTQRARIKGRWRGPYSDLGPTDGLGPYAQWDVVEMPDGRRFTKVCPDANPTDTLTGVVEGNPGYFTPYGVNPPADLAALRADPYVGDNGVNRPTDAWQPGNEVLTADGAHCTWGGDRWWQLQ